MSLNMQLDQDRNADVLKDVPKMFDDSERELDYDEIMGSNVGGFKGYVGEGDQNT